MVRQANKAQMLAVYEEQLEQDRSLTIQLHGSCMWPIVRSGDIITIEKASPETLEYGDVLVFKTSEQSLHVNTQFIPKKKIIENLKNVTHYVGKVTEVNRHGIRIPMRDRSSWQRIFETLISPANPFLLGFPKTLYKKLFQK